MGYIRYLPDRAPAPSSSGWDAWADEYAGLGETRPTYALAKELLHQLVEHVSLAGKWVLDFNCGAGDDLARFTARGWNAVGCDGSPGMLRQAARRGAAELWLGRAEDLTPDSFAGRRFDLIFSTTGGFAYLHDDAFVGAHRALAGMLAPGGAIVIAHFTPFCLAESLYHVGHLRLRRAAERWRGQVPISVRGEPMRMRLRSPRRLRRLLDGVVRIERLAPLLVVTPPFQSGFAPGPRTLSALRALERRAAGADILAHLADQVVCVARPISSSNRAR